jgi:hypothetical protein
MLHTDAPALFWSLTAIQIAGLISGWLIRWHRGSRHQFSSEWLFFACLALVGLSTMVAMPLSRHLEWLCGGATLGLMVLMAVWDFHPAERPSETY